MDYLVPVARRPVQGAFAVPASKSLAQRALALRVLAEGEVDVDWGAGAVFGDDVRDMQRATNALGRWCAGHVGAGRERLTLDLGLSATGFRLCTALALLRPPGARTLVRGRPALLGRKHRDLRRALGRLGGHVSRRGSGAHRVIAGDLSCPTVVPRSLSVPCASSSQHVSALLLLAPRLGGLSLTLVDRPVSRPYLQLTLSLLRALGVSAQAEGLDAPGGRIEVSAGAPRGATLRLEPDASAAAAWWAAAALTGGWAEVPGLPRDSVQADMRLLDILASMGAAVSTGPTGAARVCGPGGRLRAAGEVDLSDAPDLLPLVGALAASAEGTTHLRGVTHARGKESDRVASTAAAIRAVGGRVEEREDGLTVQGSALRGGRVDVAGDHRLALAFGLLGLLHPDVVLGGAQAASKSQPGFLEELARATGGEGLGLRQGAG